MTIVVNIAGTNGSGKSHLVHALLGGMTKTELMHGDKVYGYEGLVDGVEHVVHVMGAYLSVTGGCDVLRNNLDSPVAEIFDLIREYHKQGKHVIYEGSYVMNMQRGPVLATELGRDLKVLHLTTPLATCVTSINARRAERGVGLIASTKDVEANWNRARSYAAKMRDAGASVYKVSRAEALPKLLGLLHDD